jgi:hypothetical protein
LLNLRRSGNDLGWGLLLFRLLFWGRPKRLELLADTFLLLFFQPGLLLETSFTSLLATFTHDLLLQLNVILSRRHCWRRTLLLKRSGKGMMRR